MRCRLLIALFLIMFKLIDRDYQQDDSKARKIADIVVPDKTIETNLKEVKPEKVDDPEEPPPDLEPIQFDTQLDMNVANTAPVTGINLNLNASGMSSGDGEYLAHRESGTHLPPTRTDPWDFRLLHR